METPTAEAKVSEIFELFLDRYKPEQHTKWTYKLHKSKLLTFQKFLGDDPSIGSITPMTIDSYQTFLRTSYPKCGYSKFRVLMAAFNWAARMRIIDSSPAWGITAPKMPEQKPRNPFSRSDYDKMISACRDRIDRLLIMFGWHTGMSFADVIRITWESVDIDNKVITKQRKKTGAVAVIPYGLGSDLDVELTNAWRERDPNNSLVLGLTIGNTLYSDLQLGTRRFVAITKRAGIKNHHYHDFRGTLIRDLTLSGVNSDVARRITGHTSTQVFKMYAKYDTSDLRKSMGCRITKDVSEKIVL